jgi:hypothetical protein
MSATGTLGTKLYVATDPLADIYTSADTISDFQALTIDQEVFPIENLGEFSRQFELVTFNAIGDGRTLKIKGPYNDGSMQMSLAFDLSVAGQVILFNACKQANQDVYPFKVTFTGVDAYHAVCYFGGLPMSYRINAGAANNVLRATVTLEVDTEVFIGDH